MDNVDRVLKVIIEECSEGEYLILCDSTGDLLYGRVRPLLPANIRSRFMTSENKKCSDFAIQGFSGKLILIGKTFGVTETLVDSLIKSSGSVVRIKA